MWHPSRQQLETFVGRKLIAHSGFMPQMSTRTAIYFYSRWGMRFEGRPNYISSEAWFDGADFGLITLCEGCTISSKTSFLTHDWSVYNTGRALGLDVPAASINREIRVGPFSFIGRGSTVMPGSSIGRGAIIGAGSVVRGEIEDFAIVVGNPAQVVGDSREHFERHHGRLQA